MRIAACRRGARDDSGTPKPAKERTSGRRMSSRGPRRRLLGTWSACAAGARRVRRPRVRSVTRRTVYTSRQTRIISERTHVLRTRVSREKKREPFAGGGERLELGEPLVVGDQGRANWRAWCENGGGDASRKTHDRPNVFVRVLGDLRALSNVRIGARERLESRTRDERREVSSRDALGF